MLSSTRVAVSGTDIVLSVTLLITKPKFIQLDVYLIAALKICLHCQAGNYEHRRASKHASLSQLAAGVQRGRVQGNANNIWFRS